MTKNNILNEIISADTDGRNKNPLFFQHPCTIQMSGGTGSGKTVFLSSVLLDKDSPWDYIIYCYGAYQPKFDLLKKKLGKKITFHEGIPEDENKDKIEGFLKKQIDLPQKKRLQTLIIFDDLMSELKDNKYFSKLYYSGCHHLNLSVCCLTQNIFNNRTARLNCHYLCIFNFESDKSTIMQLGKQLLPTENQKFVKMYNESQNQPYGFLMVDLKCRRIGRPELKYRNSSFDTIFLLN